VKSSYSQLKYQRVEAEIRQLAQTLPLGAKLPSERELAANYNCNFLTVRKAFKELVDDGTVVRRVGSGTFISRHPSARPSSAPNLNRIGILVSQQSNAYAYRLIQAVAHSSLEQKVDLRSVWVQDFGETALAQASLLKQDGCIALTLPWFPHERIGEVREFIGRCPLPVSLALIIPGLEKNCYYVDSPTSETPVVTLCRYCHALGHRRIAMLGPDSPTDVILQKMVLAYSFYTSREHLPTLCGLVASGAQAMDRLAEEWKSYRGDIAIVSYDDEHALRFITSMHKIGLSAPEDYHIIGFNDTEASRYSDPPLSTVHQHYESIGSWLLKNALALAQGSVSQNQQTQRCQLIVRSTCGGRDKITDEFRSRLPDLDIIVDHETLAPEPLPIAPMTVSSVSASSGVGTPT
jgi:DNA-binding LacI/PurR family transcriptional regulator